MFVNLLALTTLLQHLGFFATQLKVSKKKYLYKTGLDYLNESRDASFYSKSVAIRDHDFKKEEAQKRKAAKKQELNQNPPRDLGENFVRILLVT